MTYSKGIGLVEVLIGATIITIGILALIQGFGVYFNYALANDKNVQAAYIGEEGLEAFGFLRDGSWKNNIAPLSTTTTYYINFDTVKSVWGPTTSVQYVDGIFLRSFQITDVYRDSNGKIATAGSYDQNTKLITETLKYYQGHATTTAVFYAYIANLYSN